MSESIYTKEGTVTVAANGAAVINVQVGFVPSTVELTNETTNESKLFTVAVAGDVAPLEAGAAGTAVNYDSGNGGSEGGTVAAVGKGGFVIAASLVGYNDTTDEVIRYIARR